MTFRLVLISLKGQAYTFPLRRSICLQVRASFSTASGPDIRPNVGRLRRWMNCRVRYHNSQRHKDEEVWTLNPYILVETDNMPSLTAINSSRVSSRAFGSPRGGTAVKSDFFPKPNNELFRIDMWNVKTFVQQGNIHNERNDTSWDQRNNRSTRSCQNQEH